MGCTQTGVACPGNFAAVAEPDYKSSSELARRRLVVAPQNVETCKWLLTKDVSRKISQNIRSALCIAVKYKIY